MQHCHIWWDDEWWWRS